MEVTTVEVFAGLIDPIKYKVGFTMLPHEFIENLDRVETLAELKVILYLMRHTWGFQDSDQWRHLTLDEFMHGRITKDGRMDRGTGLTKVSVIAGLEKAIEHGFILEKVNDRDLARIKKSYKLKTYDPE